MQIHRSPYSRSVHPLASLLCCGMLAFVAVGCEEPAAVGSQSATADAAASDADQAEAQADAASSAEENATSDSDAPASAVSLKQASWEEIMKAAKDAGRPTVVDVWSLSCEPCLKEFPGLVQLHKESGDKLHCISANIDFDGRRTRPPESYEEKATAFLREKNAQLTNYLCTTPNEEVYADLKIVSIPAVLVFDAQGKEVARFVDAGDTIGFTYEKDVMPFVRELLADGTDASGQ